MCFIREPVRRRNTLLFGAGMLQRRLFEFPAGLHAGRRAVLDDTLLLGRPVRGWAVRWGLRARWSAL